MCRSLIRICSRLKRATQFDEKLFSKWELIPLSILIGTPSSFKSFMKILRYFLLVSACTSPKNYIRGLCKAENGMRIDGISPVLTLFNEMEGDIQNKIKNEWNQESEEAERMQATVVMGRIHSYFMNYFYDWEDAYWHVQAELNKCTSSLKAVKIKLSIRETLQKLNRAIISPILNDVPGLSFADKWEISISLGMTAYGRKAYYIVTSGNFGMEIRDFAVAVTEISDFLSNITHRGTALNEANMEWFDSDIQNVLGKPKRNQAILEKIFVILHHIWFGTEDDGEATPETTTSEPRRAMYGYIIIRDIEPSVLDSHINKLCTAVGVSADQYIYKTATNSPDFKILIIKHQDVDKIWEQLKKDDRIYKTTKKEKEQLKVDIQKPILPVTNETP